MEKKLALLFTLIGTIVASSLPATAAPMNITSSSYVTLNFNGFHESSYIQIPGLSGLMNLSAFAFTAASVDGVTATRVVFNYSVINDSSSPVLTSRISAFAFDTAPGILHTPLNQVSGTFSSVILGANQPNGIGTVEICLAAGNCTGGGGGITLGNSGSGAATLYFAGSINSLKINDAFLRYQSVSCTAGSSCSGSASGQLIDNSQIPEPSSYALILSGIAGLALVSRYRPA